MKRDFVYLLIVISCLISSFFDRKLVIEQSVEMQELRSYNTRMDRRLIWPNAPAKVNLKSIANAENDLGTPASYIASLWFTEDGPDLIETGALRKTYRWAMTRPIKEWSAYEGARASNRLLWHWLLTTVDGKKAEPLFLAYASAPYTNMDGSEQRIWASNIFELEEKFRHQIGTDSELQAGIMNKPSYGRLEKLNEKIMSNRKVSHAGKGKKHP